MPLFSSIAARFERLVDPYPAARPVQPPAAFFPFLWRCTEGLRPQLLAQRAELQALFETEMGSKQPVIEDLVISIISSKSFEQVYTLEGKEGLRQEIINRINQLLPTQLVMYVYFNEFVVQ